MRSEVSTESGRGCVKTQSRERKGDELMATRYRTASGSDRMRALNLRSDVSFASVESCIRSLPLPVLYRVAASPAIKSSSSFTRPSFHTASVATGCGHSTYALTCLLHRLSLASGRYRGCVKTQSREKKGR